MIRKCTDSDVPTIDAIINQAAEAYRGVIPDDCFHEPYMTRSALLDEIEAGVNFWGRDEANVLVAIMGAQKVEGATLIRHAYVLPSHQGRGLGGILLEALAAEPAGPVLVGTWAAAHWAIRFYERHGFVQVPALEKDALLDTYWRISPRQRETSIVLAKRR